MVAYENIKEISDEIINFSRSIAEVKFVILFGSRAYGESGSDIDFKIYTDSDVTSDLRLRTGIFAKELNQHYAKLKVINETDVPYEYKTILHSSIITDAINLIPFKCGEDNYCIPEIKFEKDFLCSKTCQMRTTLSALTTPNMLLFGDKEQFDKTKKLAFRSVYKLITKVTYNCNLPIIDKLLESIDGRKYKEYLGYSSRPEVISLLKKEMQDIELSISEIERENI